MNKQILVLDDNQDILDVVREVLAYEGFNVTCISEAARIDETIEQVHPDLVLLDYKLMDGNGAEVCHRLKAAEATRHIPVIIFSAYIHRDEDLRAMSCDGVIAKPFDIEELVATINRVLKAV